MAKAKTRTVYRTAKRKVRRRKSFTLPVLMLSGMGPMVGSAVRGFRNEGFTGLGKEMTFAMSGYHMDSGTFNPSFMWNGTYPMLIGWGLHKMASVLGINRALGRAGVPVIRL